MASPEKPLSDLELIGYLSYWKDSIQESLSNESSISIEEISGRTAITVEDIFNTLIYYKIVKFYEGDIIFIRKKCGNRRYKVDEKCLHWKGHCFNKNSLRLI